MNNNDKILISLVTGIAIGSVLGILLTRENECGYKMNVQDKKDILRSLGKKQSKSNSLKEDIEQAVKEAFAENPEEYAWRIGLKQFQIWAVVLKASLHDELYNGYIFHVV